MDVTWVCHFTLIKLGKEGSETYFFFKYENEMEMRLPVKPAKLK
jgi:hypothetical protein